MHDANKTLGLRPEDFHFGSLPEIWVEMSLELGYRAIASILNIKLGPEPVQLEVNAAFRLVGDSAVQFWFEQFAIIGVQGAVDRAEPVFGSAFRALRGEGPVTQREVALEEPET